MNRGMRSLEVERRTNLKEGVMWHVGLKRIVCPF